MTDPLDIIAEYYKPGDPLADMLLAHSRQVRDKALDVAKRLAQLKPDLRFIEEAAMLHDIGIFETRAPRIHCHGAKPYVCHGVIGRNLLEQHGLARHGLVCERHVGAGLTIEDIRAQQLPLPLRDMRPVSLEESIICYADKFFSKANGRDELPLKAIVDELSRFGQDKVSCFLNWHKVFIR